MKIFVLMVVLMMGNLWAGQTLEEISGNFCYVIDDQEFIEFRDVLKKETSTPLYDNKESDDVYSYHDGLYSKGKSNYIVSVDYTEHNKKYHLNITKYVGDEPTFKSSGAHLGELSFSDMENKVQIWCNQD